MPPSNELTYLDTAATTPVDPRVAELVMHYMAEEFGNAGSQTHELGSRAKHAVDVAREQISGVVGGRGTEVVFTSGATESDNLATLGLRKFAEETGRRHIISTAIEHKAVLEPLAHLESVGFEVTLVPPTSDGSIRPGAISNALRPDTVLVSVMHVNNETGMVLPLEAIADSLADHAAFFHVDAAQGFGKELVSLRNERIDLISASGHKLFGPMGVGALLMRRRRRELPPIEPLMRGGGQERGLRPGTLPVPLIAGFGLSAQLAVDEHAERAAAVTRFRDQLTDGIRQVGATQVGNAERCMPSIASFWLDDIDADAAILLLKDVAAVSKGSACTSSRVSKSHVLEAMRPGTEVADAVRFSWDHTTDISVVPAIVDALRSA